MYILVSMAELSAVGTITYAVLVAVLVAGAADVGIGAHVLRARQRDQPDQREVLRGELEFWFAIVKVVAILGMIVFGGWLLVSGHAGSQASVTNLWKLGGFFPYGVNGLVMSMAILFGGLKLVGITAAEAEDPSRSIPRATNQVIYPILIFYIGALSVLLSLFPCDKVATGGSPFMLIFRDMNSTFVANVPNVIVLTAALSVYSSVYANSRMLYGSAQQGNAPRAFMKVSARGIPLVALGVSALAMAVCVLVNYFIPDRALELLMALAVSALIINWAMISIHPSQVPAR